MILHEFCSTRTTKTNLSFRAVDDDQPGRSMNLIGFDPSCGCIYGKGFSTPA